MTARQGETDSNLHPKREQRWALGIDLWGRPVRCYTTSQCLASLPAADRRRRTAINVWMPTGAQGISEPLWDAIGCVHVSGLASAALIAAVVPAKAEPIRSPVPLRRFRYDARHDILKCPRGKILRPTRPRSSRGAGTAEVDRHWMLALRGHREARHAVEGWGRHRACRNLSRPGSRARPVRGPRHAESAGQHDAATMVPCRAPQSDGAVDLCAPRPFAARCPARAGLRSNYCTRRRRRSACLVAVETGCMRDGQPLHRESLLRAHRPIEYGTW